MDYRDWLSLFGLPGNDAQVVSALAAQGVTKPVVLRPDDLTVKIDFKDRGMGIGFTSELTLRKGVADLPILGSVLMMLIPGKTSKGWTPYGGPLPYGLKNSSAKDEVIALLGEPKTLNETFCSGRWLIDDHQVGALFTSDWSKIRQLGISLPGAL